MYVSSEFENLIQQHERRARAKDGRETSLEAQSRYDSALMHQVLANFESTLNQLSATIIDDERYVTSVESKGVTI